MNGKIISFSNFKGGVGKTATTALISYNLSTRFNKKVLVIDFDPQANITNLLVKTKARVEDIQEDIEIPLAFMHVVTNEVSIQEVIIKITDNLDLIPNSNVFSKFPDLLEDNFENRDERKKYLSNLIEPLRKDYDFIFIDIPPTLSIANDNVYCACDYIIIVLQTQQDSFDGAKALLDYLANGIIPNYNQNLEVMGVLPVLTARSKPVDNEVLNDAKDLWDDYVFENIIHQMERIKRISKTGITDDPTDIHDKNYHEKFTLVAKEFLNRLDEIERESE